MNNEISEYHGEEGKLRAITICEVRTYLRNGLTDPVENLAMRRLLTSWAKFLANLATTVFENY